MPDGSKIHYDHVHGDYRRHEMVVLMVVNASHHNRLLIRLTATSVYCIYTNHHLVTSLLIKYTKFRCWHLFILYFH